MQHDQQLGTWRIRARAMAGATAATALLAAAMAPVAGAAPAGSGGGAGETHREKGVAFSCGATRAAGELSVELYSNSHVGTQATVRAETRRGRVFLAHSQELRASSVLGGDVAVRLPVSRVVEDELVPTKRWVRVTGSYERSGPRTRVHDEFDDAGQHIVVTGTNTPLATDFVVASGDRQAALTCSDAFAFDLRVGTTPL